MSSNSSHSQNVHNQLNNSGLSNQGHSSLIASHRGQVLKDLTNNDNNSSNNRLLARDPSVQNLTNQLNQSTLSDDILSKRRSNATQNMGGRINHESRLQNLV